MQGFHFAPLAWTFVALSVFSNLYLFCRILRAVKSSRLSDRFKNRVVALAGTAMVLLFVANRFIMLIPIPWVDPPEAAQIFLLYPPVIWGFGSIFSALLLCIAQIAGGVCRVAFEFLHGAICRKASAPVNPGRRWLLRAATYGLAAVPFAASGYGVAFAGKDYEVSELSLPFGRSLRVVQLSDIHAGIYMKSEDMRRIADRVIALQPDLLLLTGDYISNSMKFLPGCMEEMARIDARYGTFAVLGNHDRWHAEPSEFRNIFSSYRIRLLVNEHRLVHSEKGPFAIVGIDDMHTGNPDLEAALRGLDPTVPAILLSHRPEIFPEAAARRIPITLAGHYHGGQVRLSLPTGDLSLARLVTPYPMGLYRIDTCCLYVSRGIGTTFTPVRLNVPPEITLFNLS